MEYFGHTNQLRKLWHRNPYRIFTKTPWTSPDLRDPTTSSILFLRYYYLATFFELVMVESDGGYGIFFKGSIGDTFDEGGFACILKSNDCDF